MLAAPLTGPTCRSRRPTRRFLIRTGVHGRWSTLGGWLDIELWTLGLALCCTARYAATDECDRGAHQRAPRRPSAREQAAPR